MKRIISVLLAAAMLMSLLCTAALADGERNITPSSDWTVITIDPGHGGNGGGAYTWNGHQYVETELVLKIAYYLKAELEQYHHVRVVLTRTTNSQEEYDNIYEIVDRVNIAAQNGSDLLVSLHLNGTDRANSASGACVIVPNGNYRPELAEKDYELARYIMSELNGIGIGTTKNAMTDKDGLMIRNSETRPPETNPDGTVADYYGIARGGIWNNFPAVLVEHCHIDNYNDAYNHLRTEEQLKEIAHADATAIVKFLNLQKPAAEEAQLNDYYLTDYRDYWAQDVIDRAVMEGWIKGYSDDTFRPKNSITRGEFVTVLGRAAGVDTSLYEGTAFEDVAESSFCAAYVQWAAKNEIVSGYEDGSFYPNRNITREQIAKIMTRFLEACGFDVSGGYSIEDYDIGDVESCSDWAREYIAFCYANGLLQGNNGNFEPKRTATRAEACAVLVRMMEYDGPRAEEPAPTEEPASSDEPAPTEEPVPTEEPAPADEPIPEEEPVESPQDDILI